MPALPLPKRTAYTFLPYTTPSFSSESLSLFVWTGVGVGASAPASVLFFRAGDPHPEQSRNRLPAQKRSKPLRTLWFQPFPANRARRRRSPFHDSHALPGEWVRPAARRAPPGRGKTDRFPSRRQSRGP
ncbi:protein of unknown function [Methylacidimicrobium sp. AP8]|nr:protein of unknown function [Methylacidimicrobium sp. AP8]